MDLINNPASFFSEARERPAVVRTVKILLVALVMFLALIVRMDTFWLPHLMGDQAQYIGLAMKLDEQGFSEGFNLKGIRQGMINFDEEGEISIAVLVPSDDPDDTGDILGILKLFGAGYYDQDFFHKPPGLPFMIMVSHKLFAQEGQPYSVVVSNLGPYAVRLRPSIFFAAQFYAVIVPLFFGMGAVFLTFLLGRKLFNFRVGFYAAMLYAFHPVAILFDQRVLADSMVTFFVISALLLFIKAREKDWDWFYLFSGISCGAAVLAKQTGGYFLIAVMIFTVLSHKYALTDIKKIPRIFVNRAYVLTAIGVFMVSGFWFLKIYRLYGDPLWLPSGGITLDNVERSGWMMLIRSRPPGFVLYLIGIPFMGPPMAAAYISLKDFFRETRNMVLKRAFDYRFVFLWIIILVFGFMLREGREHRRMLTVYPLISVMAAHYYDKLRNYSGRFSRYMGNKYVRETLVMVLFLVSIVWMVYISKIYNWAGAQVLNVPF